MAARPSSRTAPGSPRQRRRQGSVTIGAAGATEADYVELAFSTPNGCAPLSTSLRDGGDAATAFSAVLLQCLTTAATGGGGLIIPLNQYRDSTTVVMENHRARVRRLAFGPVRC